jgi:hypothetical protein
MERCMQELENRQSRKELGSATAKGGFLNEKKICEKFNNWQDDTEAQDWLERMGYKTKLIEDVKAIHIPTRISKNDIFKYGICTEEYDEFVKFKKADAQIRIIIIFCNILKIENISLKKANVNADYNQIDKRDISSYQRMWHFDEELGMWLRLFTGELDPQEQFSKIEYKNLRDKRRVYIHEMPNAIQEKLIIFFERNRILVINDIIRGRGGLSADWMLVTRYDIETDTTDWVLHDINTVTNYFGAGDIRISKKGSLNIGKVTMQRKGGTPDPTKLQFKFKPCQLFGVESYHGKE